MPCRGEAPRWSNGCRERASRDAVDRWAAYVAWSSEGDPLPALAEALEWCARHRPAEQEAVVLWGDVRLGNLVFDPERRVRAVLDWDLAAIGPPEMDLGWHLGLEFMMEALFGGRVPGFPGTLDAIERYEGRSGRQVADLDWHEVFAFGARPGHQRPPSTHHRQPAPQGEPDGQCPAGPPRGGVVRGEEPLSPPHRVRRRTGRRPVRRGGLALERPAAQGAASRSEKPMTPALATS